MWPLRSNTWETHEHGGLDPKEPDTLNLRLIIIIIIVIIIIIIIIVIIIIITIIIIIIVVVIVIIIIIIIIISWWLLRWYMNDRQALPSEKRFLSPRRGSNPQPSDDRWHENLHLSSPSESW